jgi:hypothetical protein
MIRLCLAGLGLIALAAPAIAVDFSENGLGQIELTMPSGNIGCVYTPEGGSDVHEPAGGGPELSCDRVAPAYVRVTLGPSGRAKRFDAVGDASCCGAENSFAYGKVWRHDGFRCVSSQAGLACTRGRHGFSMSRTSVKTW